MEWKGKIIICDRCGQECRRAFLKQTEMDGGFTVNDCFEPMPEEWKYIYDVGWLCPACKKKYEKLMDEFMDLRREEL